jgi:hypothetical protein
LSIISAYIMFCHVLAKIVCWTCNAWRYIVNT